MPDTTHKLKCPDCEAEFEVTKTAEQFEDENDETTCPECGECFLSAIDEATEELYLLENDEDDEEEFEEDDDEE
jgi:uncharacterized cysteine cluster protein YcgN (CxxCxxCC family)